MTYSDPRFRLAFWILLAALAVRTVAMGFLPLTDATEGRYALVAKGMAETGDWITPRVWMFDKNIPFSASPLFFWAAAASMRLFGINEFASRLPSTVAAIACSDSSTGSWSATVGNAPACSTSWSPRPAAFSWR